MKPCIVLSLMMIFLLSGCSRARYVMKDQGQGIIAMSSPSDGNREKARELMNQHFPAGYTVVKEEEVPVGVTTHVHKHQGGNKSVVTRDKTEYHIHYVSDSDALDRVAGTNSDHASYQKVNHSSAN